MRTIASYAAVLATGLILGWAATAGAGSPPARDTVARGQVAAINTQMAAVADQLAQINRTLDSRLYKLCKASASNPFYTGCDPAA